MLNVTTDWRAHDASMQPTLVLEDYMAHDIDCSTGKPAIAYVGETPWHGLGEKLPEGESIETWIKAARLDWELKRLPVHYLGLRGIEWVILGA